MGNKVRVGIIGTGAIAEPHVRVLQAFDDVDVVAASSRREEGRSAFMQRFGISAGYSDFHEMLDRERPDAVLVLVSVGSLVDVAAECLQRGVPSLIEKPPGLYPAETERLWDLASRGGVPHMVGLNRRFYSNVQAALAMIRERGPLISVVVEAPERFGEIKKAGKWTDQILKRWMFANGIHSLDLLTMSGGPIRSVTAHSRHWTESIHPDSLHALIEFESGAIGHYISNWAAPGRWSVTFYGVGCRIELKPLEAGRVFYASGEEADLNLAEIDRQYKPGFYAQARSFIDAVRANRSPGHPAATLEDALVSMRLAEQIVSAVPRF